MINICTTTINLKTRPLATQEATNLDATQVDTKFENPMAKNGVAQQDKFENGKNL